MTNPASTSRALQITIRPEGDAVVLRLVGSAQLTDAAALEQACTRIVAGHPRVVVVDMSALTFIGSLGLGTIVAINSSIRNHGGRVAIAGATGDVADVIARTGLHNIMSIHPTVSDALGG